MAGLVGAEEVAGASDLQVPHGDLEARAELGVLADGAQALVGLFGQLVVLRIKKVCVSTLVGPAHPAPSWWSWPSPSMSARSITRVLTVGMSMPDSMIVVHTRTS